jgi:DNA repair exonuclease SbcCD ATPase subunit
MRYRLKHLEVAAFRGVREKLSLSLDKPLVIIYAPNGAGKSTLTTAIEYALFPKESTLLKDHEIRERTGWQVQHVHGNHEPYVRLTLTREGKDLVIEHSGSRSKKRGQQSSDPRTALKCAYADFKGLAYVHQETIRDFLIGRATPREDAFQRLLGAGWIQDVAKTIDNAAKNLRCDGADQKVAELNAAIEARMLEAKRLLEEKKEAARQASLGEPWEQAGEKEIGKVDRAIRNLCAQFEIEAPALPNPTPFKDYSVRLSTVLQKLRAQGPAQTHSERSTRKTQLKGARASYQTAQSAVAEKRKDVQNAEQQAGTEEHLKGKSDGLTAQRDALQGKLNNLNRERAVMRAALDYFKNTPHAKACPACLRDGLPEGLMSRLVQRLEAESTGEEKSINEELTTLGNALRDANSALGTLNRAVKALEEADRELVRERGELEKVLGRKVNDDEAPLQVVDAEIERLDSEIQALTQAVRTLQDTVTDIEKTAKNADQVGEILALQERVECLGQIRETAEWKAMTDAQQNLSQHEQGYRLAANQVRHLASKVAQENLDRAREPITSVYRQLTRRADFPDISIDPEKKYAIEVSGDSGLQRVTAVLNQTDLDSLAIAVVAGMATTFPEVHDLDFLILDDPSQGMDPVVTSRLAEVITSVCERIQVIIATPDPILYEKLKKSPRAKTIIQLKAREEQSSTPFVQLEAVTPD